MPVIKSAKKKLRQDKKRQAQNSVVETTLRKVLKKTRKSPTVENVRLATKAADKAVKKHIIHKNKAAHIKSDLSKLIAGKVTPKKTEKAGAKKSPSKKAIKASAK